LNRIHRDVAGAARPTLDNDLLLPRFGQLGADQAGQDIGAAAGRERYDEHDRLVRIVLREQRACLQREQRDEKSNEPVHVNLRR